MSTIYIIHGAYGCPNENWFPWLAGKLRKEGHNVVVPTFPTPEGQDLKRWFDVFEPYTSHCDEDTVMVGHSLGPLFIANVLNKYPIHIRGSIFVCGFRARLGNPDFDNINASFVDEPIDVGTIRGRCGQFIAYVSENDPYVPLETAKTFAQDLGAELITVPNAGHFNAAAGYAEFPSVLDACLRLLQKR